MPTKLGQNYLINKSIAEKIVASADLSGSDFVLEIGPGKGILTEELAKKASKVLAIEIDGSLVNLLKKKFNNRANVEIVEGDILKTRFKMQNSELKIVIHHLGFNKVQYIERRISNAEYKVVANLPYYITSPIIRMFLESQFPPREMVLMIQKEVAERITASPGKMSILSVSVQYYARPEILFYVSRDNFYPAPEVDSAVVKVVCSKQFAIDKEYTRKFFRVVRSGFCARRKTLANNLASSFHRERKEIEEKLRTAGIKSIVRAQELSVKDWKRITELF